MKFKLVLILGAVVGACGAFGGQNAKDVDPEMRLSFFMLEKKTVENDLESSKKELKNCTDACHEYESEIKELSHKLDCVKQEIAKVEEEKKALSALINKKTTDNLQKIVDHVNGVPKPQKSPLICTYYVEKWNAAIPEFAKVMSPIFDGYNKNLSTGSSGSMPSSGNSGGAGAVDPDAPEYRK